MEKNNKPIFSYNPDISKNAYMNWRIYGHNIADNLVVLESGFEEAAKHQSRIHGNIGVMTATTALKEFTEWYTSPKANFYEQLFKIIVNELCYYTEEV